MNSFTKDKQKSFYELVRFAIVGGLATVTDIVATTIFHFCTNLNVNAITTLAFIIAFWVSFFGHRFFTFKKKGSPLKFFILAISTLLIRNVIVFLMHDVIGIYEYTSLITAIIAVTAITYFIAKFKVFTNK